jgi:excisionase family DNA binding protein
VKQARTLLPLETSFLPSGNPAFVFVPNDPADDLILESINAAAKRLGCSRRTLYDLIKRGEIRTVRVATRQMIPRGERLRFVRDQLTGKSSGRKHAMNPNTLKGVKKKAREDDENRAP